MYSKLLYLDDWKRAGSHSRGQTIVFTNGCFDLLHSGHLHLLQFARLQGDLLVVAVNSDASVTLLKGAGRPVQTLEERIAALSKVPEVDAVIAFEEDTPLHLLETIRPEVYVKGADYEGISFPEADFVKSYGGRVVFCPSLEGYSTTSILAKGKQN
jgi:D-beta-D-heptose 7-phosphate kinase / D-beta-D-heptose 1-phosphate adenosyltransferase